MNEKIDSGVYRRGSKFVAKNAALGYQGTYNTEEAAKVAMKNARLGLIRTKSNTARDKKTKTKKDLIVWDLRMARNQLLSRGW